MNPCNAIWLSEQLTSPYDFHQYILRLSDDDIIPLYRYLSLDNHPLHDHTNAIHEVHCDGTDNRADHGVPNVSRDHDALDSVIKEHLGCPEKRILHKLLADQLVSLVHGPEWTERVNRVGRHLFSMGRALSKDTESKALSLDMESKALSNGIEQKGMSKENESRAMSQDIKQKTMNTSSVSLNEDVRNDLMACGRIIKVSSNMTLRDALLGKPLEKSIVSAEKLSNDKTPDENTDGTRGKSISDTANPALTTEYEIVKAVKQKALRLNGKQLTSNDLNIPFGSLCNESTHHLLQLSKKDIYLLEMR